MRLIDKGALLKDLGMACDCGYCDKNIDGIHCNIRISGPVEVCIAINHAPIIEERKTGKWLPDCEYDGEDEWCFYACSCCEYQSDDQFKYCPSCGARMEGEEDG